MDLNFLLPLTPEEGAGSEPSLQGKGLEGRTRVGLGGGRVGQGKETPRFSPARAQTGAALKLVCKPTAV